MTQDSLRQLLDSTAAEYNTPGFADNDPVQFPRMFSDLRDIEIAAVVVSNISWGKRPMILRNARRLLFDCMGGEPYRYVAEGAFEDNIDPDANFHRTFFGRHLLYMLRGLRAVYADYGSIQNFAAATGAAQAEAPAWSVAEGLSRCLREANRSCGRGVPEGPDRCFPSDMAKTALKRFNMALRWLVRRDGIVDIGCWDVLKPSQLYIPLDVHVGNTSRSLGLLSRRQNDRRAVEELTARLKEFRPEDPTVYDFALFGLGVAGATLPSECDRPSGL